MVEMKYKSFELKPNVPVTLTELFGGLPNFNPSEAFTLFIYSLDSIHHVIYLLEPQKSPKLIEKGTYPFNSCKYKSFQSVTGCVAEYRITQSGKRIAE